MSEQAPVEDLKFGESLKELEDIVAQLESGQLELEDSIKRYEQGVGLIRALQAKLAEAERKVTALLGDIDAETE